MPRPLWEDPYAAQAIGLIQDPARARARAVERVGEAQARAAEATGTANANSQTHIGNANANAQIASGNAWVNGIQNVGSAVAAIPGTILQAQQQSRQDAMAKLALAQGQQHLDATQRLEETKRNIGALLSDTDLLNEDGTFNGKGILARLSTSLPNGAVGPVQAPDPTTVFGIIDPINESIVRSRKLEQEFNEHKTNTLAQLASSILQISEKSGNYFETAQLGLAAAVKSKIISQEQADSFLAPMVENPQSIPAMLQELASRSTLKREKPTEIDVAIGAAAGDPTLQGAMRYLKPGTTQQPTQASLAADLSSNDPQVRERARTALDALNPPKQTPETRSIDVQAAEALAKGDTARYQQLIKAKRDLDTSPALERAGIWIVRNGETVRVKESDIKPGDKPASTREQGRPVTSADAGRFAELQTSLDDISTLTRVLGADATSSQVGPDGKKTGLSSGVGAGLWNAVSEYAGWGESAKERQAVIDRVRQVIGKALEGGVLRKEDEEKYKKILPTISDPPALAKSKLEGLQMAIQQRLGREIDAREDAGYDVTRFRSRQDAPPGPPKKLRYNPATGRAE